MALQEVAAPVAPPKLDRVERLDAEVAAALLKLDCCQPLRHQAELFLCYCCCVSFIRSLYSLLHLLSCGSISLTQIPFDSSPAGLMINNQC